MTTTAEIAFEESRRSLDLQLQAMDAIRTRAGTLLAASSLVTTFFGGQALAGDSPTVTCWTVAAVAAFLGVAALTIVVLQSKQVELYVEPTWLVEEWVDDPVYAKEPDRLHRDMALYHDGIRDSNESTVLRMVGQFQLASGLLAVEVVAWLFAIGQNV